MKVSYPGTQHSGPVQESNPESPFDAESNTIKLPHLPFARQVECVKITVRNMAEILLGNTVNTLSDPGRGQTQTACHRVQRTKPLGHHTTHLQDNLCENHFVIQG